MNNIKNSEVKSKKIKNTNRKTPKKFVDDTKECRICGDEFNNDNEKEPLKCGHVFHYDCIIYAFQAPSTAHTCPYCRKYHGYLRLIEGVEPIKSIHRIINKEPNNNVKNNNCCQATYKTGLKAGMQCNAKKKNNTNYCGTHKNYVSNQ